MRRYQLAAFSALLIAPLALGTGAAAAPASHDGNRVSAAFATYADPADCADGECDAIYLTAGYGVLGAASERNALDGIVIIEVAPSVMGEEGMLEPVGDPTIAACTFDATVTIDRLLRSGTVTTSGPVELRTLVEDESRLDCTDPIGHTLDLDATFTGTGDPSWAAQTGRYTDPWMHRVDGGKSAFRLAAVTGTLDLDGAPAPQVWPDSGQLMHSSVRSVEVLHEMAIGPVGKALHLKADSVTMREAYGRAGTLNVHAMSAVGPDGTLKVWFDLNGQYGGEFVWGESEAVVVELAVDAAGGSASGTLTLYREGPAGPEPVGDVAVLATWTGLGDIYRFSSTGTYRDSEGRLTMMMRGIQRDATFTLVLDGVTIPGDEGGLRIMVTKEVSRTR